MFVFATVNCIESDVFILQQKLKYLVALVMHAVHVEKWYVI